MTTSFVELAIASAKSRDLSVAAVRFDYAASPSRVARLEPLVGQAGWLRLTRMRIDAAEAEEHLVFAIVDRNGSVLYPDLAEGLFELDGVLVAGGDQHRVPVDGLEESLRQQSESIQADSQSRSLRRLGQREQELNRWAEDQTLPMERDLDALREQRRRLTWSSVAETVEQMQ